MTQCHFLKVGAESYPPRCFWRLASGVSPPLIAVRVAFCRYYFGMAGGAADSLFDVFDDSMRDRIAIGTLTRTFPRDLVDEVVVETGRKEQRARRLPARVVVYFVLAMCLFFDDDYDEVMRRLVGSLKKMGSWRDNWKVPSTGSISKARARLGAEPLEELFYRVALPVATPGTKGAWLGRWRLMAIDGTTLDVADTPQNVAEFGRAGNGDKQSAFPKVRLVGLGECGTHAIVDAQIGAYDTSEQDLARPLLRSLEPGMLLLMDRNSWGYEMWAAAQAAGADLAWRVSSSRDFVVLHTYADGSYASILVDPSKKKKFHRELAANRQIDLDYYGQRIRVFDYTVDIGGQASDTFRIITSILDPGEATAVELAAAYHERWEYELGLDEMKTHQRGPARILRSKSPDMVRQEIYALLATHYAIRKLMTEAADEADYDPDRMSFIHALRLVRRHVTDQAGFSP
jgi:hypothetical protein